LRKNNKKELDMNKAYTIRFTEKEWEALENGFKGMLESVGVQISKHQFLKSCVRVGLEDFASKT